MLTLIGQLLSALLWLPLALCKPILRAREAKMRRSGARRVRPPALPPGHLVEPLPRPRGPAAEVIGGMKVALTALLDGEPTHRRAYRHLARFERKFNEGGLRTLEAIPVADLRRALRDFEAMVRNWSEPSLADLRSRMSVTLTDRSSAASMWIAENSVNSAFRAPGA